MNALRRLRYGTRITIVYTVIVAIALLAFSALAFGVVRWSLATSTATRLETTAAGVRGIPDVKHGHIALDADDRRQFLGLLNDNRIDGAAVDNSGHVLLSNLADPPAELVGRGGSAAPLGVVHHGAVANSISQPIVAKNGAVAGFVVVWSPRRGDDEVARITVLSLLAACIATVAVAAIAGGIVIRRMLQPIVDLNAMISAIEASDLGERLDWDGPDDELGRLCAAFDRLLDRLQSAFERERRFTANASHELRTPLAVMRAEIELTLLRSREGEAYRETLRRLQSETNRLEALVESLLLTARSDAGLAALVARPVAAIARGAVARLDALAAERNVRIGVRGDDDAWALIDPALLESALVALLDNALRYTAAGGDVDVTVQREDRDVALTVADGGDGFSPDALRLATQRFWRDDASRSGRGMGLGLAIVAAIVERHGGSIELRNDGGGVVELRIPAVEGPQGWVKSGVIGTTAGSSA
jgi:signal transduction histidine kinase